MIATSTFLIASTDFTDHTSTVHSCMMIGCMVDIILHIQAITEWVTVGDTIVGTEVLDILTAIMEDITRLSPSDLEDIGVTVVMAATTTVITTAIPMGTIMATMVQAVTTTTVRLPEEGQLI